MIRTRMMVIGVAALLATTACGGKAHPGDPGSDGVVTGAHTPDEVVDAARRAVEQWRQAYEVKSVEALAPLYLHGPDLVVVRQGRALIGWPAVEASLTELTAHAKEIHIRLGDVVVAALGPSGATVSTTMAREVTDGVTTVTEDGVLTLALREQDGAWIVVAEHYSFPPKS